MNISNSSETKRQMPSDISPKKKVETIKLIQSLNSTNPFRRRWNSEPKMPQKNIGKILVVDDEKYNCDVIMGFMMILGIQNRKELVEFAYNGEQALDIIQKSVYECNPYRFSLILMDCNMPFLDGFEATKRIRRLFSNMEIPKER